jgi:hypothetical protein
VASLKSEKPADAATSNRLRKHARLSNQRRLSGSTYRPSLQSGYPPDSFESLGSIADRILARVGEARGAMSTVIGIDPGAHGAIAMLDEGGEAPR